MPRKKTTAKDAALVRSGKEPQRDMTHHLGKYAVTGGPGRPKGSKDKKPNGRAKGTPNGPDCFRALQRIVSEHDKEALKIIREAKDFLAILDVIRRDPRYLHMLYRDLLKKALENPSGYMLKMEPFYANLKRALVPDGGEGQQYDLIPTEELEVMIVKHSVRILQATKPDRLKEITGNGQFVLDNGRRRDG